MSDSAADVFRSSPATRETARYLASSDSDHRTGKVIMIDGGMVFA